MPRFCSIVGNEKYSVGCTGQTVWVWDKSDTVLAKFKDINYAYKAAISPKNDIFVVKSTSGKLAVYSFCELSFDENINVSQIQEANGEYYVLGYLRNAEGVGNYFFCGQVQE